MTWNVMVVGNAKSERMCIVNISYFYIWVFGRNLFLNLK